MNSTRALTKIKQAAFVDPALFKAVLTVNALFLNGLIGLIGIVANIINIINFQKQGYKDGVNVTLTALAVSDLGVLITQLIIIQIYNPWLEESSLLMLKPQMLLLVIYINEYFIRASGFVTACAAFERCLCVVLPMKVKLVMTRRVAAVVNISIFIVLIVYVVGPNSLVYVGSRYIPEYNRTFAFVYYRDNREAIMNIFYIADALFIPNITMLMLLLFTVVLVTKLKSKFQWRQMVSNSDQRAKNSVTLKERKAIAMLSTMSGIYVVCLLPHSALNLAVGLVDQLRAEGGYFDLTMLAYSSAVLFETVNCSVTAVVYFKMSSKYREIIYEMLPSRKKK
ncbi:G-protein coupled receptor [Biomphalaria pfeifferi]|uniref:G-protein coupled receptor n=1 Tax=Biomphalaria pfeifferi TaxID=112525 RepID=A0AAD8C2Q0_BIOPF|nr:G-protein coupled receptor [Biomphalaria pfeifferi]